MGGRDVGPGHPTHFHCKHQDSMLCYSSWGTTDMPLCDGRKRTIPQYTKGKRAKKSGKPRVDWAQISLKEGIFFLTGQIYARNESWRHSVERAAAAGMSGGLLHCSKLAKARVSGVIKSPCRYIQDRDVVDALFRCSPVSLPFSSKSISWAVSF